MKKKIALILIIVVTAIVSSKITQTMQPPVLLGDVNRDSKLTSLDLDEIKRHIVGNKKTDIKRADMNFDHKVTLVDLVILKKYITVGGK